MPDADLYQWWWVPSHTGRQADHGAASLWSPGDTAEHPRPGETPNMLLGGEKRYRIRVDDLIILLKTQNILCGIAKKKKTLYVS